MVRKLLAGLVAVASATVATPPATAAPSPYVVYEVARVRPGGPGEFWLRAEVRAGKGNSVFGMTQLTPSSDGGYELRMAGLAQAIGDGRWKTYGWPVAAPACPALCGSATSDGGMGFAVTVRPGAHDRLLVAGPRGGMKVGGFPPQWRLRETRLGMRTLYTENTDATGFANSGIGVEHFRSASLPGGRHGSLAFADIGCDLGVGTATFETDDGSYTEDFLCAPDAWPWSFATTYEGRRWSLTGNVVAAYTSPLRLLVIDIPKR